MLEGHVKLGLLAGLTLSLLAGIQPSRAPAQAPELIGRWRQIFKRPNGPPPAPPENPLTPDKITLGSRLFSDKRLSGKGERACSSCHLPARAFTDGRRRALSLSGAPLRRNTPALFNLAWSKQFFWDGRAPSLEMQVGVPVIDPQEMAGDWHTILSRLQADGELARQFHAAFPERASIDREQVVQALSAYLRSLVSPQTRFDEWIDGNRDALQPAEIRGFGLFVGKAGCVLCHVGWRFTDDRFHDIGLASADPGRGAVAGGAPGLAAFKTPGLRELERTAPYMHDGSLATLGAVLSHYSGRFVGRPSLAPQINRRLRLNAQERADMVAFLRTLSAPSPRAPSGRGPD